MLQKRFPVHSWKYEPKGRSLLSLTLAEVAQLLPLPDPKLLNLLLLIIDLLLKDLAISSLPKIAPFEIPCFQIQEL